MMMLQARKSEPCTLVRSLAGGASRSRGEELAGVVMCRRASVAHAGVGSWMEGVRTQALPQAVTSRCRSCR